MVLERPKSAALASLVAVLFTSQFDAKALAGSEPAPPEPQVLQVLKTPGPVSALNWSSNGTKFAAASLASGPDLLGMYVPSPYGGVITIWNADGTLARQILRTQPFFQIGDTIAFVAQDTQLVTPPANSSSGLAFSVFDVESGEIAREITGNNPDRPRYANAGSKFSASPDGLVVAVTFQVGFPQPVALYSTRDWAKIADLPSAPTRQGDTPNAMAFSRDSKLLAMNRHTSVLLYEVSSAKLGLRLEAFPDLLGGGGGISFSPDGNLIAVGSDDLAKIRGFPDGHTEVVDRKYAVRVFRTTDGSRASAYEGPFAPVKAVSWSPDGRFIAFLTEYRRLHLWNPFVGSANEQIIELSRGANSLAFSPDGEKLAVGGDRIVTVFRLAR